MKVRSKRLAACLAALLLTGMFAISAHADYLTDTHGADEYITINKKEIPNYDVKHDVGSREDLRLVFNIPADELEDALFINGLDHECYFRLEIHNAKWRNVLLKGTNKADINYVTEGAKDYDDKYSWEFEQNNIEHPITSLNNIRYNESRFEDVQYVAGYFYSDGRSLKERGYVIDGEYPLLFRTQGNGEITIDISVYTGDNLYDSSKFTEDDYEYIGTVTVASAGKANTTVKAATTTTTTTITTETTTAEPAIEQTTAQSEDNKIRVEVPIGQPYYTVNGAGFEMDAPAFIHEGYTMLPIRAMAGVIGIDGSAITYDAQRKTAVINYSGAIIGVSAGEDKMYINNVPKNLDTPALINNGRMYLPMRAIAEALGFTEIDFDTVDKIVIIDL